MNVCATHLTGECVEGLMSTLFYFLQDGKLNLHPPLKWFLQRHIRKYEVHPLTVNIGNVEISLCMATSTFSLPTAYQRQFVENQGTPYTYIYIFIFRDGAGQVLFVLLFVFVL